jgi:hypothetical protein
MTAWMATVSPQGGRSGGTAGKRRLLTRTGQRSQYVALDGQRGVTRRLLLRVPQDGVGVGVHDDRGMRTMAR